MQPWIPAKTLPRGRALRTRAVARGTPVHLVISGMLVACDGPHSGVEAEANMEEMETGDIADVYLLSRLGRVVGLWLAVILV